MQGARILILGGGDGGLVAAGTLRKLLGREHEVTLIDRERDYAFRPSFLWVMLGQKHPRQVLRSRRALATKGIEFLEAEIAEIDLVGRQVTVSRRGAEEPLGVGQAPRRAGALGRLAAKPILASATIPETRREARRKTEREERPYDYLIISLGADLDPEAVPGAGLAVRQGQAHVFYDLEGATRLREALREFQGGTITILVSHPVHKCPPAPYDAAFLLDDYFRRRRLRDRVTIRLVTPDLQPLPADGPEVGKRVLKLLQERHIDFQPGSWVTGIDPRRGQILLEGGGRVDYHLLLLVPPHKAPEVVQRAGLTSRSEDGGDTSGWIIADPKTLATGYEDVYAVGDVTGIRLPVAHEGSTGFLPKAGVFAHFQAEVVARNIASAIKGEKMKAVYDGFVL
ncbi:MAG: NAD(P)/FAD-dependent oxidoreductase [Clostridia bacterium]|nr:NAD(P)/FAD-dependent oxidoreductase [Clostridia bacterium]